MCSVQEMQRVDRELSLELEKSPINPAFLHTSAGKREYSFRGEFGNWSFQH